MHINWTETRKGVINVLTVIVAVSPWILNAAGQLPGGEKTAAVASAVLGLCGAVLHYLVPNTTTNPEIAATQSVKLVAPKSVAP